MGTVVADRLGAGAKCGNRDHHRDDEIGVSIFLSLDLKPYLIVHHPLVSRHGSRLALEEGEQKLDMSTLSVESFEKRPGKSGHIVNRKTIPMRIENFHEATHMSAFVVMRKIYGQSHSCHSSLLVPTLVFHHQWELQGLHPNPIDRNLAVVVFVLGIFEFTHLFALNQKTCPK